MTCGAVWMFIFIVLDFIKIVITCIVGLALGAVSTVTSNIGSTSISMSGDGTYNVNTDVGSVTASNVEDAAKDFETLFTIIYIQAAILGLMNIATMVFLGRYVCCTDTFEARKSAVMGITIHIAQAIVAVIFFVLVWVIIFGVDFGDIMQLVIATVVECLLWAMWRNSYKQHCAALAPAGGVTVVKA